MVQGGGTFGTFMSIGTGIRLVFQVYVKKKNIPNEK
jgi:hypothetical protein